MQKLPHPERAVVPIDKLLDYCLNPEHPDGKHKARVFKSALNLSIEDAETLRAALLYAINAICSVRSPCLTLLTLSENFESS